MVIDGVVVDCWTGNPAVGVQIPARAEVFETSVLLAFPSELCYKMSTQSVG